MKLGTRLESISSTIRSKEGAYTVVRDGVHHLTLYKALPGMDVGEFNLAFIDRGADKTLLRRKDTFSVSTMLTSTVRTQNKSLALAIDFANGALECNKPKT